jgi:DNA-binding response OmpR family regulator
MVTRPSVVSRVLVVEDDEAMRATLRQALEREGHRVLEQVSGDHVLALLESQAFDVVVLDRDLPGKNGLDLLPVLRRRFPSVAVIFITAFGGARVAEEVLLLGAARYLEKPFRMRELLDAVLQATDPAGGTTSGF